MKHKVHVNALTCNGTNNTITQMHQERSWKIDSCLQVFLNSCKSLSDFK